MGDWAGSTIERVGGWDERDLLGRLLLQEHAPGRGDGGRVVTFPLGEASTRASGRGVDFVCEGWRVREGGGECVLSWGLASFNSSLALSESFTNYLLDDEQNYHLQVEALWLVLQVIRGDSPCTSCHRPQKIAASSPTESWESLTACSWDRRPALASTITRCMGAALNTLYSAAR